MKKFFHLKNNLSFVFLVCIFIVLVAKTNSFAHKVNIFAYVEGDLVYTESYFPDGQRVEKGTIEVYDSRKNKLLSGTTDKKGQFHFHPPKRDDLTIFIIAGMGHKNSYFLSADELPDTISEEVSYPQSISDKPIIKEGDQPAFNEKPHLTKKGQIPQKAETIFKPDISGQQVDLQNIKDIIDQSLEQKLRPVMRELVKIQHEEKISLIQIFGGIGYIFGIIGIILYFTKKNE